MGLVEQTLAGMKGQTVVVVTSDHRAFRGVLLDADAEGIVLDDAVEGTTAAEVWTEVHLGSKVGQKLETPRGTMTFQRPGGQHQYRLTRVVILRPNIFRVWQVVGARPVPKTPE